MTARPLYAWYVVAILLLTYILSFTDRIVLGLLVDPIRRDLGLSDTQIGLLIGFGFVIVYSLAGLILGRAADLGNRRLLIVGGLALWSLATIASGFTAGFGTLLLARVLVGVGESALTPASYSLIASYFDKRRLGLAISVYSLGTLLGGGIASLVIGGIARLVERNGWGIAGGGDATWRTILILVGLIGLPLVLLVLTIREPVRDRSAGGGAPPVAAVLAHLRAHAAMYAGIFGGYAVMAMTSYSVVLWAPTYFIRAHGFSAAEAGAMFGIVLAVGGTIGMLAGGWISDRLMARGVADAAPRVVIASLILQMPLLGVAYLVGTSQAVPLFALGVAAMALQGGLQGSTLQLVAPPAMRGILTALYFLAANMIGMGLGSLLVPLLTERVFGDPLAIGRALAAITLGSSLVAIVAIAAGLPAMRQRVALGTG